MVAEAQFPVGSPLADDRATGGICGVAHDSARARRIRRERRSVLWRLALAGGEINLWVSFTCVEVCYGLLVIFRETLDRQGPLAKFLSDNAFSVYVFHPPIVILAARILRGCTWLPILKFIILTGMGVAVTFALSAALFRRTPILRNIL